MHGDMDDNVHPANTIQLIDELIKANKTFDLIIAPNRNHGLDDRTSSAGAGTTSFSI
jgi:dipeptidyl aminopeptidase/acylaminoacyl peptidase